MYYWDYNRAEATKRITDELEWVYPGAHYYDDLYHSLIKYVHRTKFNIDMNMNSDSALVRSQQMSRDVALKRAHSVYAIEDEKVIDLCIKRLGLTKKEFEQYMSYTPKTFRNYKTIYNTIRFFKIPVYLMSKLHLIPRITYDKYFNIGN